MSGPASPSSDRVRLARAALESALAVPGVVRGEAGPGVARVTADGCELLSGVSAIAQSDGRYAIDLRLVARLVPLSPLAENVRAHVRAAAARAGLTAALGSVDIEFADVLTSEEIERAITTTGPAAPAVPAPPLPSVSTSVEPPAGTSAPVPEPPGASE